MAGSDLDALASSLDAALDDEVTGTTVLGDGLNLNVAVATASEERAYVVRRPNELRSSDLFVDLATEYRVLEELAGTAVPAPEPVLFCEDESVLGAPFLVTSYLDGEPIPLGTDLPERFRDPESRRRVAESLVDTLAALHTLDTGPFETVCEPQTAREQLEIGVERLEVAAEATGREFPEVRAVGERLFSAAPSHARTTLVHGDFRPGNVLFVGSDRPEIGGVLDWETAMLGDPLTEVGYLLLRWRDPGDPSPALEELAERYPDHDALEWLRTVDERGFCPFSAAPGSPTRGELAERYEAATGIRVGDPAFYVAHAAFMLATVWADLDRHDIGDGSGRAPLVEYVGDLAGMVLDGAFET